MIFLNLGKQPLANNYDRLYSDKKSVKYNLSIDFNYSTKIVSIKKIIKKETMFNSKYPYRSSLSKTMKKNFLKLAINIKKKFKPKKILEIGCNDGVFLNNFKKSSVVGVEPCKNIAKLAKLKKLKIYDDYWTKKLATKIKKNHGLFDIIYSANTITHIQNLEEVFKSINLVLDENGTFIIEDPSLLDCIKNNAYDQFYNEHIYVFSYLSLNNILKKHNLVIFKIEKLDVHGGSLRYYIKKNINPIAIQKSVNKQKKSEINYKLYNKKTYMNFGKKVNKSKYNLISILKKLKNKRKNVIGYGATAKSVTVLNYCKIDKNLINFFVDTTPEKQNKYIPGTNIIVKKYQKNSLKNIDYVFLGAWNFKKEIFNKEKKFLKNGIKFITHIPKPRIIKYEKN